MVNGELILTIYSYNVPILSTNGMVNMNYDIPEDIRQTK